MPRLGGKQGKQPERNPWEEWEQHPVPPELVVSLLGTDRASTCLKAHWTRDEQVRLVLPDEQLILPATARPIPSEEWEASLSRVYPAENVPVVLAKTRGVWRFQDKDGPRLFIVQDGCSMSVPDDPRWQEHVQRTVARVLVDSVLRKVEEIQPGGAALLRQHPELLGQLVKEYAERLFSREGPETKLTAAPDAVPAQGEKLTQGTSTTVYVTRSGSTFHRANCRYVTESPSEVSRNDAEARGLRGCSTCRP
jgi:hypothetical protein